MTKKLKIFSLFLSVLMALTANSKIVDVIAEEAADFSVNSDQKMKSDYDLRQVQDAFNNSKTNKNIKNCFFENNNICKIPVRLHMNTLILFPQEEEIFAFTIGDEMAFDIKNFGLQMPNALNIKPLYSGVDTNLVVIMKSQNVYSFYLRSYAVKSQHLPSFVVYARKPEGSLQFAAKTEKQNNVLTQKQQNVKNNESKYFNKALMQIREELVRELADDNDYLKKLSDPNKININYTMYGEDTIAPYGVYDDGRWTYFDFRPRSNYEPGRLPAIYKVINKHDAIVNTRFKNGFLIAESLSPEGWTLKNGKYSVCVKHKN